MKTYWLSMHVPYVCRHSGVCCSSGWAIAVEHTRADAIGRLRPDGSWLRPAPEAPPEVAGTIALAAGGHCTFHRDGCEIQRAYGHAALPAACQHFPREVLIDGRGVSVTLSHYCPTAAALLFDHVGPVDVVEGPPAVPAGEPEGLDARDVLPPLLSEGVLMDLESYSAWEHHMVAVLTADDGRTPDDALDHLDNDLATLMRWRPGRHPLIEEVARLAAGPAAPVPSSAADLSARVIRRYLAARAFASWMAYQAGSVAAVLRSLRFVLSVLGDRLSQCSLREAIRQTDLQVLHLMSRDEFSAIARRPA